MHTPYEMEWFSAVACTLPLPPSGSGVAVQRRATRTLQHWYKKTTFFRRFIWGEKTVRIIPMAIRQHEIPRALEFSLTLE